MKKAFFLLAMVFTLGLSSVAFEAEAAKRMGSGKSMGMQRQANTNKAPPATPAQNQATTPGAAGTGAAAPAPSSRSWMGPVAGIAAGLGLAALASHLGFGEEMASMLMMGLLAVAVMAAIGFFMRKRAAGQAQAGARAGGMQYAPAGAPPAAATAFKAAMPSTIGSGLIGGGVGASTSAPRIPADFDVAGFERQAKVNFIRLQAANDAGNLDDLRQFTSPEMFAELKMDLADRGGVKQHTDVVSIDAKVLDVVEDAGNYIVSVRFTGVLREDSEAQSESVDEVWHLTKPLAGHGGWVLAGIEQM